MAPTKTKSSKKDKNRPQIFKALAHPLRMRLLAAMSEREASPSELAAELDEPLGNVAYHVRMLEGFGCIELVRTTPRRGALEHHYRAVVRPVLDDEDWQQVPKSARHAISADRVQEIFGDVSAALSSGSFDQRTDRHLSWMNLALDEEGWQQLNELLVEVVDRAQEIQAESASRLASDGDADSVATKLALLHYLPAKSD
jgi:DNA-binding transcriptional ArsR family regulator